MIFLHIFRLHRRRHCSCVFYSKWFWTRTTSIRWHTSELTDTTRNPISWLTHFLIVAQNFGSHRCPCIIVSFTKIVRLFGVRSGQVRSKSSHQKTRRYNQRAHLEVQCGHTWSIGILFGVAYAGGKRSTGLLLHHSIVAAEDEWIPESSAGICTRKFTRSLETEQLVRNK